MKKHLALFLIVLMAVSVVSAAGLVTAGVASAKKPALATPQVISPNNHLKASVGSTISFEWKAVDGADWYGLVIQKLGTGGWTMVTGISGPQTTQSWTFNTAGTYRWAVSAGTLDHSHDSAPTNWRTITIE